MYISFMVIILALRLNNLMVFLLLFIAYIVIVNLQSDSKLYLETKEWFIQNLPNPPFYDDNNSINAVTLFKDGNKAPEMITHLEPFFNIANKYNVEIIKSISKKLPGLLIYEDEYQIGIIPHSVNVQGAAQVPAVCRESAPNG